MDGPPPVDPGELTFLAVDTRAPYTRDYDGPQGNKIAHYMLRWINSRGEVGPRTLISRAGRRFRDAVARVLDARGLRRLRGGSACM